MQDAAIDQSNLLALLARRNGMGRIKGTRNAAINPCCTTYSMLPLCGLGALPYLRFHAQDAEGTDGIKRVRYQT